MQRAYQPRGSQPALAHPRMRVCADIVERVNPLASVADHDLAPSQGDGTHAALGDVGEWHDGLETGFAHFGVCFRIVEGAHFNRDLRRDALNLSAVWWNCGASGALPPTAAHLNFDFRLEDRYRLADDPDPFDDAILDFELDVHAPGPVQLMPLHATERNTLLVSR